MNMCKGPLTDVKTSSSRTVCSAVHHVALHTVKTDVLSKQFRAPVIYYLHLSPRKSLPITMLCNSRSVQNPHLKCLLCSMRKLLRGGGRYLVKISLVCLIVTNCKYVNEHTSRKSQEMLNSSWCEISV